MSKRKLAVFLLETSSCRSSSSSGSNSSCSLGSITTNGSSIIDNNEAETDELFFPLMRYLSLGRHRRCVENFLEIVESWPDEHFKDYFRVSRATALQLTDEFNASRYAPMHTFGVQPISSDLCILLFLWYMANTEPLRTMSCCFDVSISSVFRVIRRVITWLLTKLDETIKWPQGRRRVQVSENFFAKRGIPGIVGAIDCTHIRMQKPSINEQDYCNRKKFFSIHLQAVVDANLRFTNIYCGEPGSLHDARVLRRSPLMISANEEKQIMFPDDTFIIGDSAYPSLSWLVPPFRNNGYLSREQKEFNFRISSTRVVVEKAFGNLKGRFRRIKFFNEYKNTEFLTKTVVAACILYNYCKDQDDEYYDENVDNMNDDAIQEDYIPHNIDNRHQIDRRTQLFRELFPDLRN